MSTLGHPEQCRRQHAHSSGNALHGFTLIELVIIIVFGVVVMGSLLRLLDSSTRSYAAMDSLVELNQNVSVVLNRLTQDFMQAGADMPQRDSAVLCPRSDSIVLVCNPTSAFYPVVTDQDAITKLFIQDAEPFFGYTSIRHFVYDPETPYWNTYSLTSVDTANDTLHFASTIAIGRGDVLYCTQTRSYSLDTDKSFLFLNLDTGSVVLADNISEFSMQFFTDSGSTTTDWHEMRTCSLCVEVRHPTRKSSGTALKKRQCKMFFFRNRIF